MKTIEVQFKDYGWFSEEPITVRRFDETSECCGAEVSDFGLCSSCKDHAGPRHELIWCNHANVEDDEITNHVPVVDGQDMEWTDKIVVCLKCNAWKLEFDDEWRNAPFEGIWNV